MRGSEMHHRAARARAALLSRCASIALLSGVIGCGAGVQPTFVEEQDARARRCGNGVCSKGETCASCPADCGPCSACGDGACNGVETCDSCPGDCGACPSVCGDGTCNGSETCSTCAGDCGACSPAARCGDGTCNGDETCDSCPSDCGTCPTCGDATCDGYETCLTCSADCGSCPAGTASGRVAFVSNRSGEPRIYLANADGSGVTPLTTGAAPAWSPDGRVIAFHRSDGIHVVGANGAAEKLVKAGGFTPTWSPDGSKIAYVTGIGAGGGLYAMNADGTGASLIVSHEFASPGWGDYCACSPAWSPDGGTIAFVRANYEDGWGIYAIPADGSGSPTPLRGNGWSQASPAWSRDGSRIAFDAAGPGGDQIGSMSPTGGDYLMHATAGPLGYVGDSTWSPDGGSLAFSGAAIRGTPTRIFVVRRDGSVARLIPDVQGAANPGYADSQPAWSWAP